MQRDQPLLIDAWCRYHGHLFGFENLVVLDNGSVLPETVETLRRYERVGSTVFWQYRSAADHAGRQDHFAALARRDDGQALAVGLDCDEWLALFATEGLSCDRDEIMAYLDRPGWTWPGTVGIEGALVNVPTSPGWFCGTPFSRRCSTTGTGADANGAVQSSDFVIVRFANRPFAAPGPAEAVHVAGEPGVTTAARCRRFFAGRLLVEFGSLAGLAQAIGVTGLLPSPPDGDDAADGGPSRVMLPVRSGRGRTAIGFDAASYLLRHADVAAAGWPALEHFVRHGVAEDRRW